MVRPNGKALGGGPGVFGNSTRSYTRKFVCLRKANKIEGDTIKLFLGSMVLYSVGW